MANKKKRKKENGPSKISPIKAQIKPERKPERKKMRKKSAQREESLKEITEVSSAKYKDRCYWVIHENMFFTNNSSMY